MAAPSTVLIVDDDASSRLLLGRLLSIDSHQVLLAHDGAQALVLAHEHRPDVILLDILMPGLDGFEICRRLRADADLQQVPIVLLTALDDRDSRLKGLEAGADDFLSKPFDSVELRTRLRTITRLNRFRRLCEERSRFETAVAYSPDAIVLTDDAGHIVLSNPAFHQLVVPSAADDHALTIFDHFGAGERAALQNGLRELTEIGRRLGPVETTLCYARAPATRVELTVGRLPGATSSVLAFNIRDITEKKQLEQQLLRSQRIEILGQLAGSVAHDVNNIFTAISGNAALISDAPPADVPACLANIQASVRRGAGLLRQLLMFARGSDQEFVPTSTVFLVHETAGMVSEVLGTEIDVVIDLPESEPLPEILGDANQLHQVLMNFCINARDAMPGGGTLRMGTRQVSVSAPEARQLGPTARPGVFVTLSVHDTGTGMSPEVTARLFDPFFTTKPPGKGTGLGLATVLRVVKRHDGFIVVETTVGAGTGFTCYFPVPAPIAAEVR